MTAIIIAAVCILSIAGAIAYNPLRRKMAGIIGVGGAYAITVGLLCIFMTIGQLFNPAELNAVELVTVLVIMLACLGYMVYVMLTRCQTLGDRILLPFAAFMIGMGFAWRLVLSILLHIPMESGEPAAANTKLPEYLIDDQGDTWDWQHGERGQVAEYQCRKTGERITLRTNEEDTWIPTGWRGGNW